MQRISKPHLVDLLRFFDKKRIFSPRIRYASVRSKPELIRDLLIHFWAYIEAPGHLLTFGARRSLPLPKIQYDLKARRFLFDGQYYDVPKQSRERPRFSISHVPVTLRFPRIVNSPSSKTVFDDAPGSPGLGSSAPLNL